MMTAIDRLPTTTNIMPSAENTNNMSGIHQLQRNVPLLSERMVVGPKSTSSSSSHLLPSVSMHGDESSMIHFDSKMLTKNPRKHSDPPGRRGSQHPFYNAFDDNSYDNHNDNNDDSMSYDTTIYDDDDDDDVNVFNDDDEYLGSTASSTPTPSSSTQNKRVRFGNITTYEVPSQLNEYMKSIESDTPSCCNKASLTDTSQLWYSSSDMIATRKDGRHLCLSDSNVKQYLYYYEMLYRKLIMSHSRGDDIDEMETLSTFDQMNLTRGLYSGYQGIEREGNFEQIRQSERRQIVRMIVELHKSMRQVQLNDDENIKSNELLFQQQQLHTYAASLSKKMSYWARYIGQAAYVASQE